MEYSLVHALIMLLCGGAEYFGLHARAYHPEWVRDYITE
jgi:hypothetical protein